MVNRVQAFFVHTLELVDLKFARRLECLYQICREYKLITPISYKIDFSDITSKMFSGIFYPSSLYYVRFLCVVHKKTEI